MSRITLLGLFLLSSACEGRARCPEGTGAAGDQCVEVDPPPPEIHVDAATLLAPAVDPVVRTCDGPSCPQEVTVECFEDTDCRGSQLCVANRCVECDSSARCPAERPVCADERCVECVVDDDCDPSRPHCAGSVCRGCLDDAHCGDPRAARCDAATSSCIACAGDVDCAHLGATPYCAFASSCVACLDDVHCGGTSCVAFTCTATPLGSVERCATCLADGECAGGLTCRTLVRVSPFASTRVCASSDDTFETCR